MTSILADLHKTIFMAKITRNLSNTHKVMMLCQLALLGIKGLRIF